MSEVVEEIDRRLSPWREQVGADWDAYRNHVQRVLAFCDELHAISFRRPHTPVPSTTEEFLTAAAFHDIGIWSAGTFDYLPPSAELARQWLDEQGRGDLKTLVVEMISDHHKVRRAAAPASPVEMFRRADTMDVSFGLIRYGVPRAKYSAIAKGLPDTGFHRRLVDLTIQRTRSHPTSPLPMFKW